MVLYTHTHSSPAADDTLLVVLTLHVVDSYTAVLHADSQLTGVVE